MKILSKVAPIFTLALASMVFSCKKDDSQIIEQKNPIVLSGNITANTTLDANEQYILKGQVYVKDNVTLTIPAGTIISVHATDTIANKGALIITRGSKININGTNNNPVVFTSNASTKAPGDWIGIIILGKAATNGANGLLNITGLASSADTEFGGASDDDNSGSIKYLRVEYAGGLNPAMEEEWALDMASGLSLDGVGSGTTLENVMVKYSRDDAFQFVGGTVNGKYLIAYNNGDDNFDFDRGYRGKLQFIISYRSVPSTVAIRANGMESLNDKDASDIMPYTHPIISNMTNIGPSADQPITDQSQGIYIRRNTRFNVQNSIIAGYTDGGLMLCPKTKPLLINNLGSLFKYNLVNSDDPTKTFMYDNGPSGVNIMSDPQVAAFAIETGAAIEKPSVNNNAIVTALADLKLKTIYAADGPDLTPLSGSASVSGSNFDDADFATFFTKVAYRGAVATNANWAASSNWASWK
ncbi:MAG: hypothetical protein JWN56_1075 [Sphingobacteriales bacterium]|nr:hypothetical protein [Sphingobacteriales bacterium]